MIQVVIPAAGSGQRFKDAGYKLPKPLIDVLGKPMIKRVMDNLRPTLHGYKFIVIHRLKFKPGHSIANDIVLTKPTDGAVDTLWQAFDEIDGNEPLLIANCDQLVDFDVNDFIASTKDIDGALLTFKSNKPHHSYVKTLKTEMGELITEIKEKEVISNNAVTGVYYFNKADDFFSSAATILMNNTRFKNEFYVSAVIDDMISNGAMLRTYEAPSAMLGTPEELDLFLAAVKVGRTL